MLVGAYPSAPERARPDAAAFDAFHERIALVTGCSGFEIPFGSAFVPEEAAMLRLLARSGRHVLTLLPAVLERGIGLASADEGRRGAAVALTRRALVSAAALNDREGRLVIDSVLVHSAPAGTRDPSAARAAFARSLGEVARKDRDGVRIVVEHCDSLEGPDPVKGFLDLGTELEEAARHGLGIAINWGRSWLETRRLDGPLEHARRARDAGTLVALGVSGASDVATRLGPAFSDAHLPVRTARAAREGFGASLLDPVVLAEFLAVAPEALVLTKVAGGEQLLADSAAAAREAVPARVD
ncbi:DUF4862 family protein [Rathayibacter sp. VKM Ac-2630]|uniref:DUF4862 family protein n=1 Tax=Rathayibacter sp. VKM Ac-2630 TaxID=1938617 RepID=UPI000980D6E8|nr:DUF4862 family protein [Rathayibacter sp. VKM Ac-2630]OOB91627.1 hypothetical protein B0T42_04975 [Rathayibacter sp. VKM Ac-2630]